MCTLPFSYFLKTKNKPLLIPSLQDTNDNKTDEQVQMFQNTTLSRHSFVVHMHSLALGKENTLCCFQEHVFRASED